MAITHPFVCAIADDAAAAAAGEVVPSNWNADHAVTNLTLTPTHTGALDIIKHESSGATGTGGYDWKLMYDGGGAKSNGPVGEVNYIDDVWTMGIGIGDVVGTRASGQAALAITMESKFYNSPSQTSPWSEFHVTHVGTGDEERRLISFLCAHDDSYIGGSFTFDFLNLYEHDGTQRIKFDFTEAAYSNITFQVRPIFSFDDNNVYIFRQRNAANTGYVELPYISSDDRLYAQQSGVFVGATPTTGSYAKSFFVVQPTSGSSGGVCLDCWIPTISGNYSALTAAGSVSNDLAIHLYNNNTAGSSAKTILRIAKAGTNGDPCVRFELPSASVYWSCGIDNSDSDSFKISRDWDIGTSDALRIDSSNNARFYGSLGVANATNGQACEVKTLTELTTIAASATTDTTIQMPANSLVLAVSVRVTTAVTCTSTFTVGDASVADRFNTAAVSKAVNSTDKGTKAGAYYNATAASVRITPDTVPSDATGRVRVTIHYIEITPPTS